MQQVIDRQAAEIEVLRARLTDNRFGEELQHCLVQSAAAAVIAAPATHLRILEMIVHTSMQVVAAEAAALLLVDEKAEELSFEVALGPHAAAVQHLRVPLGHGIAGLVAMTGQPMIIADAEHDPRQASDIAQMTNYTPHSILCVPLISNDRVIGVFEMLDKHASATFAVADMELLVLFAEQAAVTVEQSLITRDLSQLLATSLAHLVGSTADSTLADQATSVAQHVQGTPLYERALDLAMLVREIAGSGEAELRLCEMILRGFAEYLRTRPTGAFPGMPSWG